MDSLDWDELEGALGIQFRLALASPLWRNLPQGVLINPREWKCEIIELRPERRLFLRAIIPWHPSQEGRAPLEFLVLIWNGAISPSLHRLMARRLIRGQDPRVPARSRLIFYDMLSHALVCQVRPAACIEASRLNRRRAQRMVLALIRALRKG